MQTYRVLTSKHFQFNCVRLTSTYLQQKKILQNIEIMDNIYLSKSSEFLTQAILASLNLVHDCGHFETCVLS